MRRILFIILLSVIGRAALPLCAQTVINIPVRQFPPLHVLAESVEVELPAGGITLGSDLVVSGGDGIYAYSWTTAASQEVLGTASTLAVTASGTYFLAVTDGHGCRVSTQFTVTPGTAVTPPGTAVRQTRYFDLQGRALARKPAAGVFLRHTIYTDGTSRLSKVTLR